MTYRQRQQECALFAACAAAGVDYVAMSDKFARIHGAPWRMTDTKLWAEFIRGELGIETSAESLKSWGDRVLRWNMERFVISTFGEHGHIAYVNAQNIVEDGCWPQALRFSEYTRLLGERGGIVTGYMPLIRR